MILISYLCYRRKRPQLHAQSVYRMPGGVVMCWVVLAFFAFSVCILATAEDTRAGLMLMPIWFGGLAIGWFVKNKLHPEVPETSITQSNPIVDLKQASDDKK